MQQRIVRSRRTSASAAPSEPDRPASRPAERSPLPASSSLQRARRLGHNLLPAAQPAAARRRLVQRQPEVEATEDAIGQDVVRGMIQVESGPADATHGVYYAHNYEPKAIKGKKYLDDAVTFKKYKKYKKYGEIWKDEYRRGYADPSFWQRTGYMKWELKDNVSAAAAIQSWLGGLTIAECFTVLVAIEADTVRRTLGDANFDYLYGTLPDSKGDKRLVISQKLGDTGSAAGEFLTMSPRAKAARDTPSTKTKGKLGERPVKPGDWIYIYNHPKFLLKHPGSAFQGENAVYIGDRLSDGAQLFSGFGMSEVSEEELLQTMVEEYDLDRDENDYRKLVQRFASGVETLGENSGSSWQELYNKYKAQVPEPYWEEKGVFPDKINDVKTLLEAPSYTMPEAVDSRKTTRTGGFVPTSGKTLEPARLKTKLLDTTKERLEARDYTALSAEDALDAYFEVDAMGGDELRPTEKEPILDQIVEAMRTKTFAGNTPAAMRFYDRIKAVPSQVIYHPKLDVVLGALRTLLQARRFEVRAVLLKDYFLGETVYVKMTSGANSEGTVSTTQKMRSLKDELVREFRIRDLVNFGGAGIGAQMTVRLMESATFGSDNQVGTFTWDPTSGALGASRLGDYSVTIDHKYA